MTNLRITNRHSWPPHCKTNKQPLITECATSEVPIWHANADARACWEITSAGSWATVQGFVLKLWGPLDTPAEADGQSRRRVLVFISFFCLVFTHPDVPALHSAAFAQEILQRAQLHSFIPSVAMRLWAIFITPPPPLMHFQFFFANTVPSFYISFHFLLFAR